MKLSVSEKIEDKELAKALMERELGENAFLIKDKIAENPSSENEKGTQRNS